MAGPYASATTSNETQNYRKTTYYPEFHINNTPVPDDSHRGIVYLLTEYQSAQSPRLPSETTDCSNG